MRRRRRARVPPSCRRRPRISRRNRRPNRRRRAGRPPEKESFWDRLRSRWAFPTLATVGAVAVFMVANRVFLNPERTLAPRRAAVPPSAPALSDPARAEPRWTGEPPELDQKRPGDRWDRAGGPRDDESRAHHRRWADGDLRGAGKKMKKGEDAERELAERPGAKGGARAEEKPKRDRDEPPENKFAPPPPPRDGTPAGSSAKEWADKAVAPREEARGAGREGRPVFSAREKAGAREGWARPRKPRAASTISSAGASQRARGAGGTASGKGALGGLARAAEQGRELRIGRRGRAARARDASTDDATRCAGRRPSRPPARRPRRPAPPPPAPLTKSRAKKSSDVVADDVRRCARGFRREGREEGGREEQRERRDPAARGPPVRRGALGRGRRALPRAAAPRSAWRRRRALAAPAGRRRERGRQREAQRQRRREARRAGPRKSRRRERGQAGSQGTRQGIEGRRDGRRSSNAAVARGAGIGRRRGYMQEASVNAFTHPESTPLPPTMLRQLVWQLPLHG